jgi:hypothetical protein
VFYQSIRDAVPRFGDVIRGFVKSTPVQRVALLSSGSHDYQVEVTIPTYCVILSPCCSIRDGLIALAPLRHVMGNLFLNPYFAEDLTRINRLVAPEKSVSPDRWSLMSDDEKSARLAGGPAYTFMEYFIYEEYPDVLPKYEVKCKRETLQTGFYMIDFRDSFRVTFAAADKPESFPPEARLLQMTRETRAELRKKVMFYYSRVPDEDNRVQQATT